MVERLVEQLVVSITRNEWLKCLSAIEQVPSRFLEDILILLLRVQRGAVLCECLDKPLPADYNKEYHYKFVDAIVHELELRWKLEEKVNALHNN